MSNCKIVVCRPLTEESMAELYLLYLPLMDYEAIGLYQLLRVMENTNCSQADLVQASHMNQSRFVQARKSLEQFHLLQTYYDMQNNQWLYHVFAPLHAQDFLVHDTFGRLYLSVVGPKRFDEIKLFFSKDVQVPSTMNNVSESYPVEKLDNWNEIDEKAYHDHRPQALQTLDFDFDTFLQGMERIFPLRMRTESNLTRIAQLASIHGIDPVVMKRYVMRSINPNTHVFDFEKLKAQVYHNQTKVAESKDPYTMAPVAFMQRLQKGSPVAQSDRKLIESLISSYHFSNEVMNVLIEYTLQTSNQKFPKQYVEKIAASWTRLGIDTKEKALAQCKNEKASNTSYPSWYQQVEQEEASEDLKAEIQQMQKQLKGE